MFQRRSKNMISKTRESDSRCKHVFLYRGVEAAAPTPPHLRIHFVYIHDLNIYTVFKVNSAPFTHD